VKLFEEMQEKTKTPSTIYLVKYTYAMEPEEKSESYLFDDEQEAMEKVYDIAELDCRGDFSWLEDEAREEVFSLGLASYNDEEDQDERDERNKRRLRGSGGGLSVCRRNDEIEHMFSFFYSQRFDE